MFKRRQILPLSDIPHLHRIILGDRHQVVFIRSELHTIDWVSMSFVELEDLFLVLHIPDLDASVVVASYHALL